MAGKTEVEQWMDGIKGEHVLPCRIIGVEIVGRILIRSESDYSAIEQIVDSIREVGACEMTKQVSLVNDDV